MTGAKEKAKSLHDSSAEEADTDHKQPARDDTESVENIGDRKAQAILSKEAVERVEDALVGGPLLPCLLGMDLVETLRSDGGRVQVAKVDRGGGTRLAGHGNR